MLSPMARFVLWDIDGTLLRTPGVGMAALHRAIKRVTGRTPMETLPYAGLLDRNIALLHLEALGADGQARVEAVLAAFLEELEASKSELVEKGYLMPGVVEILSRLSRTGETLQTVVTGNLRGNAVLKLASFGLDHWLDLDVGAYSDDGRDRHELVPVALRRASELRNRRFRLDEVWVVGDTHHDLACARAAGVRCLLVETGWEPLPESARAEADAVLPDLSDVDTVLKVIMS
jgi:phosphoglycolate phosphatase